MQWEELHRYWFGSIENSTSYIKERLPLWFYKNDEVDAEIRTRFSPLLKSFKIGSFEDWQKTPSGYISLIVLLDQVPRNSFRGTAQAFEFDSIARKLCKDGLGDCDRKLTVFEKLFFYLPLEHSENLLDQDLSIELFTQMQTDHSDGAAKAFVEQNLNYAVAHRDIIQKFGRFPHRNEALGRASTPEEVAFLKQPGSSF